MSMLAAPADVEKVSSEFIYFFGTIIFGLGGGSKIWYPKGNLLATRNQIKMTNSQIKLNDK